MSKRAATKKSKAARCLARARDEVEKDFPQIVQLLSEEAHRGGLVLALKGCMAMLHAQGHLTGNQIPAAFETGFWELAVKHGLVQDAHAQAVAAVVIPPQPAPEETKKD